MNATIFRPTVADAARCRSCELAAYGSAATLAQWQQLLKSVAKIVATGERAIVAIAVARGSKLSLVAVRPQQQRKRLGSELMQQLPRELELRLKETDLVALKFAVSVGFRVQRLERDGYSNCDAIRLRRE